MMIERNRHECQNCCGGKYAIQKYWFDDLTIDDVMKTYGIKETDRHYEKAKKIVMKSKKDFRNGWSFFTREDIDKKIVILCMNV